MVYTISKAAERVGLTVHTLRYYEKEGLITGIEKDEKGNRYYSEHDIGWLELIKCLKQTGMPIASIRHIVELNKQGDTTIPKRQAILIAHKQHLYEQMAMLEKSMVKIDEKIAFYSSKKTYKDT